jgi:hypothetical protein
MLHYRIMRVGVMFTALDLELLMTVGDVHLAGSCIIYQGVFLFTYPAL